MIAAHGYGLESPHRLYAALGRLPIESGKPPISTSIYVPYSRKFLLSRLDGATLGDEGAEERVLAF